MARRFLQTEFWARFKGAHGWKPLFFTVGADDALSPVADYGACGDNTETLTVLVRSFSVKVKRFSLAYIPMAPEFLPAGQELEPYYLRLQRLASALKPFLPRNTLFVRFDPPIDFTNIDARKAAQNDIRRVQGLSKICKSTVDIQPPDTVLLALDKSEEDLLAAMKSKWRYNIRLAAKKGVEVSRHYASDSDFDECFTHFYDLFQQTSERDGVSFHGRDYYLDLLRRSASASVITLYLAKHENDYLAGIITLFCEREAVYLYGASGNIKRNFMPAYLLQWTAIQDAKKYGCPVYDFYGMPPTDDENHPMHGLYLFKTGFGGTIVHRPGSFDIPLKPLSYRLYTAAERLRAWFFKKVRKKFHRH